MIAPMVATRNPDVAFLLLMSGSGVLGDDLLAAQTSLLSEEGGVFHEAAKKNAAKEHEALAIVKTETDGTAITKTLREKLAGTFPEAQLRAEIGPELRSVKCPALALNREKDLEVSPKQNVPAIRKALKAGGNKSFEVDDMPGLIRLFQTTKTSSPIEYAEIEETNVAGRVGEDRKLDFGAIAAPGLG